MWNRAERRGRAASRIVRSTKSSSPAGLAYTAVLPKEAPLLYCTPSGLSIAPPSRGQAEARGRTRRDRPVGALSDVASGGSAGAPGAPAPGESSQDAPAR